MCGRRGGGGGVGGIRVQISKLKNYFYSSYLIINHTSFSAYFSLYFHFAHHFRFRWFPISRLSFPPLICCRLLPLVGCLVPLECSALFFFAVFFFRFLSFFLFFGGIASPKCQSEVRSKSFLFITSPISRGTWTRARPDDYLKCERTEKNELSMGVEVQMLAHT